MNANYTNSLVRFRKPSVVYEIEQVKILAALVCIRILASRQVGVALHATNRYRSFLFDFGEPNG